MLRVRIEAPSSPFPIEKLSAGVERLRASGCIVDDTDVLRGSHAFLNGDDDVRRRSLEEALNSDVDVVWLARGGYGLARIVGRLDVRNHGRHPTVCGFSDATALFGHLVGSGVPCVHGPLATTIAAEPEDSFRHCLDVLGRRAKGKKIPVRAEQDVDVEGWLFAGNVCVLSHLVGTASFPNLEGAILVLEEVGERPYRIDRMLTQLKESGALAGVRAVVVGHLTGCEEPPSSSSSSSSAGRAPAPTALDVFRERLGSLGLLVAHGLAAGHEPPCIALPLGARARLTGGGGTGSLELLEELPLVTSDAERVLREALDVGTTDGTTPGAAALVITRDGRRFSHVSGALHRGFNALPIDDDTVWDLASLTKLVSTTLLCARAIDLRQITLAETPWPRWPQVSVEHLLRHEGGLPAWLPLFEDARRLAAVGTPEGKRIVVEAALAAAPDVEAGVRTLYSDVGFIALGALLEERLGAPLERLFHDAAHETYGASGLRFVLLDVDGFHPAVPRVAPTERCPWRRRALHGQVHDENCFAMGGASGHAGLFGSLLDVEKVARFFLTKMTPTLAAFAAVPKLPRRPIGFDRVTPGHSTTGDALSAGSVGHLGFTGTSLWIDPQDGAAYVLLTNRVHETREHKDRILALRRAFHRAASTWVRAS